MRELELKGMTIGSGMPKVIVSLMGATADEVLAQAEKGLSAGADCFEYRADYASDPHDVSALVSTARALSRALPENPVLFTCRTAGQGGTASLSADELAALCSAVIADRAADAIDIESWLGDDAVSSLCAQARQAGMASVVSFHDFEGTPVEDELVRLLLHFDELGADIPKVAVMANSAADALALLSATERVSREEATGPLLAMAMGAQGSITRLTGELFGSALTFCALERPSAPGQVSVAQAKGIMQQLHEISTRR